MLVLYLSKYYSHLITIHTFAGSGENVLSKDFACFVAWVYLSTLHLSMSEHCAEMGPYGMGESEVKIGVSILVLHHFAKRGMRIKCIQTQ